MSYNKFKIEKLQTSLHLNVIKESWLPDNFEVFGEDSLLMNILGETEKIFLGSEKARSEFVIAPVLQAFRRKNKENLAIFSGYEFNIDKSLELNGYCDFILSTVPNGLDLEAPAFFVVEAKKWEISNNDIAQCGAEMYAAQIFNAKANKPQKAIYGCVTSGFSWGFLKLENQTLSIDTNYVPLTFKNPYLVLAVLQWLLGETLAAAKKNN